MQPDWRLRQLAQASANFGFLLDEAPLLLSYGAAAEAYVFDDPNASMVKARQFGEALADILLERMGLPGRSKKAQVEKLAELNRHGVLTPRVRQVFDEVRRSGNTAVHSHAADQREALGTVHRCFRLAEWFHRIVPDDRAAAAFVPPTPRAPTPELAADLAEHRERLVAMRTSLEDAVSRTAAEEAARRSAEEELRRTADARAEADRLVTDLRDEIARLRTLQTGRTETPAPVRARQRSAFADRAREVSRPPLTEAETRVEIGAMLAAAGWVVQDRRNQDLVNHRGVAVREMPLGSGRADYALHVDGRLVGAIEAKCEGTTLSAVSVRSGTVVPTLSRTIRRQRYESLDDDLTYLGKQLGRSTISRQQLRLVLSTFRANLFTEIFPGRRVVPKTLIFAKDDNHAEEIVRLVRAVFEAGDEFCERITYKGPDPESNLARLRNSRELRIAATVDMIATGTDVRPLECVFFLRDVQSWAYFEQMKGRGARTLPEAEFRQARRYCRTHRGWTFWRHRRPLQTSGA